MDISTGMQASNVRRCNEAVGGYHINTKLIQDFPAHDIIRGGFSNDHFTYIRMANADEVTYESFVENVMILS